MAGVTGLEPAASGVPARESALLGLKACHAGILYGGEKVAGVTGLEPAASCVTGRRSNQLSYTPALVRRLD